MTNIVNKPWGREIVYTDADLPYVGKIIHLNASQKWSLQYHDRKLETFALFQGQANLIIGETKDSLQTISMVANEGYTIKPNIIHRVEAITDCVILETSTPETGTTYRLEDEYNRPNETPEIRNSPNRGWSEK